MRLWTSLVMFALVGCAEPTTYALDGLYRDQANRMARDDVRQAVADAGGSLAESMDSSRFTVHGLMLSDCEALRDRIKTMPAVDHVGDCQPETEPIST